MKRSAGQYKDRWEITWGVSRYNQTSGTVGKVINAAGTLGTISWNH